MNTTDERLSRQGVALPDAARTLGVSLRTVQRRLDRGELAFIERDGKRFVLLEPGTIGHDKSCDSDATNDTTARQVAGLSSEREIELKEEIRFLRGLVEQRDRDAAEMRAALREALKAHPKQLSQSTDESARIEQDGPQKGDAGSKSQQGERGAGIEAHGTGADELDAGELLELCRRISR